ncbi:MAG: OadG family protein [Bacteroidales bacterium]|nr:OadG family protein [Bacteroidales bacterium]
MNNIIIAITWDWGAFDSFALTVGVVGVLVVFFALLFLSIIYRIVPKLINFKFKRRAKKNNVAMPAEEEILVPGEVNAAIGAAIYLYLNDLHDVENPVLTVDNREVRRQSPWSDKHQFLNQNVKR